MQQKKRRLLGLLVVLTVTAALGASIITFKSLSAGQAQTNAALQQELSAVTEANEALRPMVADAETYQQQYDTLSRIAGEHADPAVVSSGLTSSAMETAARQQGYVFPNETVFQTPND